jgi:hypothetical protein
MALASEDGYEYCIVFKWRKKFFDDPEARRQVQAFLYLMQGAGLVPPTTIRCVKHGTNRNLMGPGEKP